eukprot:GHVO01013205.1.p2 GENE.GHVO01013205.1~~GHVO01013205.1.p2  ORF type:complete len:201 (+),score=22.64 GHVO01013205.1:132-734(+)
MAEAGVAFSDATATIGVNAEPSEETTMGADAKQCEDDPNSDNSTTDGDDPNSDKSHTTDQGNGTKMPPAQATTASVTGGYTSIQGPDSVLLGTSLSSLSPTPRTVSPPPSFPFQPSPQPSTQASNTPMVCLPPCWIRHVPQVLTYMDQHDNITMKDHYKDVDANPTAERFMKVYIYVCILIALVFSLLKRTRSLPSMLQQ